MPTPLLPAPRRPRRRPLEVLLLTLVISTTACGAPPATDGASPTDPAPVGPTAAGEAGTEPSTTEGAAAPTIDLEHALGTVEVPADPHRVVTVGLTEHDAVLALGVTPVAVTDWYGDQPYATWPWAQGALGDAEPAVLSASDGLEYERIAALEPDLILGTNAGLDEAAYERLSAIAPTVAHPVGADSYFSPWEAQALLIGDALGRGEEMRELVADVNQQFADAAAAHPEFEGTSIIFLQNAFYDGQAIAYQDGLSTDFLTDLGFTVPPELDPFASGDSGGQAFIPLEQLSVLDTADVLLWATESPDDVAALGSEAVYSALDAVQDGRLAFTDGVSAGAIYFTSVLSLPFLLDDLVPALASTLAGEGPATIRAG